MSDHFRAIGFNVDSDESFFELMLRAANEGESFQSPAGLCARWAPGERVELWPQAMKDGRICGGNPYFEASTNVAIEQISFVPCPVPELTMEGSVDGVFTAGPAGSDGEGLRVMFCAPDYGLASDLVPEGGRVLVQLAAFAHHMRCEDIESEFVPTWWFKGSPGLDFGPDGRTEVPDPPRPIVAFSGRINGYQRRANPVTGLLFEHMRVETCIGEVDVVAAPDSVDGQIEPGRMALGEFWLTGRIVGGETGMFA